MIKFIIFLAIIPLFTSGVMMNYYDEAFAERSITFEPKSLYKIGDNSYLLIFIGCTGSEPISADEIEIVTDTETVLLVAHAEQDRVIPSEECRVLEVQIRANDPASISIQVSSLGVNIPINPEELEDDTLSFAKVDVKMGFPTQISIRLVDLSHRDDPLTEKDLKECEKSHDDYTNLSDGEFSSRYLYHPFMGDCIMLYEDPIWDMEGMDRYEQLSDRLRTLQLESDYLAKQIPTTGISLTKKSVVETQIEGVYLVTFEGCTGNKFLELKDVFIASDKEAQSVLPPEIENRIIKPGICRSVEFQISADDPESIRITIPSMALSSMEFKHTMDTMKKGPHMSPRAQMKQGVPADEVVCKEGLQLIKKSRDGSAACVSDRAVSKLIERGWGHHF